MNLRKLPKQLRREIGAHPKQAAVLGLLAAVALYFWAPLVIGWAKPEQPGAAAAQPAASAPAGQTVAASALAGTNAKPKDDAGSTHSWEDVARWIDGDPQTHVAVDLRLPRDPFGTNSPKAVPVKKAVPKPSEPEITPQAANLVLSGTIMAPQNRVARISGKTYQQGQTIELVRNGKPLAFEVVEIEARRVVLRRLGKQYDLKISPPGGPGRVEIFTSAN